MGTVILLAGSAGCVGGGADDDIGGTRAAQEEAPNAENPSSARPSEILAAYQQNSPPDLYGQGTPAERAEAFARWASASWVTESDTVRATIAEVAGDSEMVGAFIDLAENNLAEDPSFARIALALLGEMRDWQAVDYLQDVVLRALPTSGTEVEGEILERSALEGLQAKAIDGVAFFGDQATDTFVLEMAGNHESLVVRAEAIRAHLWNHGYSSQARQELLAVVAANEQIHLDRPEHRHPEFNDQLAAYLAAWPETQAPDPVRENPPEDPVIDQAAPPPQF